MFFQAFDLIKLCLVHCVHHYLLFLQFRYIKFKAIEWKEDLTAQIQNITSVSQWITCVFKKKRLKTHTKEISFVVTVQETLFICGWTCTCRWWWGQCLKRACWSWWNLLCWIQTVSCWCSPPWCYWHDFHMGTQRKTSSRPTVESCLMWKQWSWPVETQRHWVNVVRAEHVHVTICGHCNCIINAVLHYMDTLTQKKWTSWI